MFATRLMCWAFIAVSPALWAQETGPMAPVMFSGQVVKYTDTSVTLKDQTGAEVTVAMMPEWMTIKPRITDNAVLKKGDFIASANKPVDAHAGTAIEVRIMEPGYVSEGAYFNRGNRQVQSEVRPAPTPAPAPMSTEPPQAHGTIANLTKSAAAVELDLNDGSTAYHLTVPNGAPVTVFEVVPRATLKSGTRVDIKTRRDLDGQLRATRLQLAP